jgi:hypothetical protein
MSCLIVVVDSSKSFIRTNFEKNVYDKRWSISYIVLRTNRVQNSMSDFTQHDVYNRQNVEINDYVNLVLVVLVINVCMMFFVVVVVVFSFAFIVSIVFFFVKLIAISLWIEFFATFTRRVKLLVANDTHFDDDNDDVLDFWLRVWLNFVEKCEIWNESKNNNDHDECWFSQDKTIDANIQKSIDRVINVSRRIQFVWHDFMRLSNSFDTILCVWV